MALSKPIDPRLDNVWWYGEEVQLTLENNVELSPKDELVISSANVPLGMLTRHLAMVSVLELVACTVSEGGSGREPTPEPRLQRLYLEQVSEVSRLGQCGSTLTQVNKIWLNRCPGFSLSHLSPQVFPALTTLELWNMSRVQLDAQLPPTVRTLVLWGCDKVVFSEWRGVSPDLQHLKVKGPSTLILDDATGDVPQWKSLQELTFENCIDVRTTAGTTLRDVDRIRKGLNNTCPRATIRLEIKPKSPKSPNPSLEPKVLKAYEEASRDGTQPVYRSRIMLLGHSGAGKTSLKMTLMHRPFDPNIKSTTGVDIEEDESCVVDVETAVNWYEGKLDYKEEFIETATAHISSKTRAAPCIAAVARTIPVVVPSDPDPKSRKPVNTLPTPPPTPPPTPFDEHKGGSNSAKPLETVPQKLVEMLRDMQPQIIDITSSIMPYEEDCGRKAVFFIWDFGGQQLYYTMHQTFLSRTAFYLIVMDINRELDDKIETSSQNHMWDDCGHPKTSRDFLDFWLKSVHTHLIHRGSMDGQSVSPPVIIVCTKKDLLEKDKTTRDREIKRYIEKIRKHLEGKPYYKHVRDIIAISNCDADDPEVDRLREVIVDVVQKQPYWGKEQPLKWLLLADMLREESKARCKEPVLKREEAVKIADELGLTGEHLSAFLQFYHNLGDLVYFNEPGTDDIIVLSPQWLAKMFCKVITHHLDEGWDKLTDDQKHLLRFGMLSTEVVDKLPEVGLPTHPQTLIRIMERFDMMVACSVTAGASPPSQVYLVPCLLQKVNKFQIKDPAIPSIHFKFVPTTDLRCAGLGKKGFLPPGLFHRLMSKCCTVSRWQHYSDLIFFDYMVFDTGDFCFALHMVHNGITLSAFDFRGEPLKYSLALNELKEEIQSRIAKVLDQVFPNLLCMTFLPCCFHGSVCSSLPAEASPIPGFIHVAHLSELERKNSCPEHRTLLALEEYRIWFGVNTALLDVPTHCAIGNKLLQELQPHMTTLLSCMPYKVKQLLMAPDTNLLTLYENEEIEAEHTTSAQNVKMYRIVLTKLETYQQARAVKEAVCKGLCQSSQYCPFSMQQTPATGAQQHELLKLRNSLLEMALNDNDRSLLLAKLEEEGIIDDILLEDVNACKTRHGKMDKLLVFISRMHSRAHECFLRCLRESLWWKTRFGKGESPSGADKTGGIL